MTETVNVPTAPVDPQDTNDETGEKKTRNGRRYRLFEDGEGDYRFAIIATDPDDRLPVGAMTWIPGIGGFKTAHDAHKWLRREGHKFSGKSLILLRGLEMFRIEVSMKPMVTLEHKARRQVSGDPSTGAPQAERAG